MKKFDVKSFAAGVIVGTLGISTAFAATGIKSAVASDTVLTLKGASLALNRPLVSVTMDSGDVELYVPAEEALGKLGYGVYHDSVKNTLDLVPGNEGPKGPGETGTDLSVSGNTILNLANRPDQRNIAESGSFVAGGNQTLVLTVASDIKGGTVDLFLFDPAGKEQRITIGAGDLSKEIPLSKGTWQYNCSGMFKDGGDVKIVGTIK